MVRREAAIREAVSTVSGIQVCADPWKAVDEGMKTFSWGGERQLVGEFSLG